MTWLLLNAKASSSSRLGTLLHVHVPLSTYLLVLYLPVLRIRGFYQLTLSLVSLLSRPPSPSIHPHLLRHPPRMSLLLA